MSSDCEAFGIDQSEFYKKQGTETEDDNSLDVDSDFVVLPEFQKVIEIFLYICNQWRTDITPEGKTIYRSLDYNVYFKVAELYDVDVLETLKHLQYVESGALQGLNENG